MMSKRRPGVFLNEEELEKRVRKKLQTRKKLSKWCIPILLEMQVFSVKKYTFLQEPPHICNA